MRPTDFTNRRKRILDEAPVESDLFKAFLAPGLKGAKEIKGPVFGKGYAIHAYSITSEGYDKPIRVAIGIPLKKSIDPEVEMRREDDQNLLAFEHELEKFQIMLPKLMKTHTDKFVAILNGAVVDHDKDELKLTKRIYSNYPNQFVLVREVKEAVRVTFALESPEGVGR